MSEGADNANSFSKKVGIDPSGFRKKMKGESPVMPRDVKSERKSQDGDACKAVCVRGGIYLYERRTSGSKDEG